MWRTVVAVEKTGQDFLEVRNVLFCYVVGHSTTCWALLTRAVTIPIAQASTAYCVRLVYCSCASDHIITPFLIWHNTC